jgi:ABC-type dipeptide/oligopeptide/nickel transport system ATPase component
LADYYPAFSYSGEPASIRNGINYVVSCGPFDLEVDSMTTLSFGMIMGDAGTVSDNPDTSDLMQNVRTATEMYRLYFQGSGPPDQPVVHAVAGDQQITLYWDAKAEASRDAWKDWSELPWEDRAAIMLRAAELLARFGLDHMTDEFAGGLSGGQRKLLEMARALMMEPEVVMLDEPMAGVNPALTQSLLSHITGLRDGGKTVVFVEHDMDVVQEISDWVVVMAQGKIIAEGLPGDIARNRAVIDAYLGQHHGEAAS